MKPYRGRLIRKFVFCQLKKKKTFIRNTILYTLNMYVRRGHEGKY